MKWIIIKNHWNKVFRVVNSKRPLDHRSFDQIKMLRNEDRQSETTQKQNMRKTVIDCCFWWILNAKPFVAVIVIRNIHAAANLHDVTDSHTVQYCVCSRAPTATVGRHTGILVCTICEQNTCRCSRHLIDTIDVSRKCVTSRYSRANAKQNCVIIFLFGSRFIRSIVISSGAERMEYAASDTERYSRCHQTGKKEEEK